MNLRIDRTDLGSARQAPSPEPRQRWRVVFRRDPVPADFVGRAAIEAWQAALSESGLALAQLDATGRPRVAFAAPLAAAAEGEAELAEIFLAERVPAWRVREGLSARLPAGHHWLSAEDVWLGAPALPGRVIAADWRVELEPATLDAATLSEAAASMLAAPTLPRVRSKGGSDKEYDLRRFLDDLRVAPDGLGGVVARIRTRFVPELGSGRPEDVLAALAEASAIELIPRRIVRERLVLAGDTPSALGAD
jgi:radical SAM-linked protein